jgi:hypothetical protein
MIEMQLHENALSSLRHATSPFNLFTYETSAFKMDSIFFNRAGANSD